MTDTAECGSCGEGGALEISGPCPHCGGAVILRGTVRPGVDMKAAAESMLRDQRDAWERAYRRRHQVNIIAVWWVTLSLLQIVPAVTIMLGPELVSRWLAATGFLMAGFAMAVAGGWLAELKGASLWR